MSRISRDTLEHIASLPNLTNVFLPKWLDLLVDINNLEENKVVISKDNLYLSNFNLEAENYFIRNS